MTQKEKRFFDALENVFIGVPVEGESGYINLMQIKAQYFRRVLAPRLQREADDAIRALCQQGATDTDLDKVREEIFDKLYTFFHRYFTESGSLGFFFTPYHQSIYERVYTDDRDVMLFWKTSRLYYVKTDRLFQSMEVSVDGFRFYFDVSGLEHKKANEKRELVYTFRERRDDGILVFSVSYSERGTQTKIDDIRRAVRDALGLKKYTDAVPSEEILERAFRIFERQSQVDYFICKDARSFLREQFDLWLWQYLLGRPGEEPQTEWTEARIRHLQALKRLAYRAIDLIAAFEDELVRIWNKPKFVLRSGYVITLDRIHDRDPQLVDRLVAHPGWADQVQEWRDLGIVGEDFSDGALWETTLEGRRLHPRYRYLPVDTRYFKDLELAILALFDPLDEALDGWLIHSENYQALNTLRRKFQGKVRTIYIDPPFNKEQDADYAYMVRYKDATWITLLENRLQIAREILSSEGNLFVRCDYNGNMFVRMLLGNLFEVFKNEIVVKRTRTLKGEPGRFHTATDTIYFCAKSAHSVFHGFRTLKPKAEWEWVEMHLPGTRKDEESLYRVFFGQRMKAPEGRRWALSQEAVDDAIAKGLVKLDERTGMPKFLTKWETLGSNWTDISGYSPTWGFTTENSEQLLQRVIESTSQEGDMVLDFFLGIGTTVATAHKLKRRWLGVEMGHYFGEFYLDNGDKKTGIMGRMKEVLAGRGHHEPCGISRSVHWQGGGFFKYYELEQYEDTLRRTRYLDDAPFTPPPAEDPCRYLFLRDPKMLEALEVDLESGAVQVDLSRLYPDIDLAETLSNLLGKPIRRIHPAPDDPTRPGRVEFTDGTSEDLLQPDWRQIKPLIWW